MEIDKKKYEEYVKQVTPTHSLAKNMAAAFLVGGIICALGQFALNFICLLYTSPSPRDGRRSRMPSSA